MRRRTKTKAVENFRANLRTKMERDGVSQRELAARVGTSFPYVSKILMGRVCPSLGRADDLASHLGLDLGSLLVDPKKFSKNGH
jgi:transcriptional regulator with XRE-family HTH domain